MVQILAVIVVGVLVVFSRAGFGAEIAAPFEAPPAALAQFAGAAGD